MSGAPCCELCKLVWNLSCAEPGQGIMLQPFLSQALSPLVCVTMSGQGKLGRASSSCSQEDVNKLLRENCASLGDGYKDTNFAMVVASYESFLLALLSKTPRVNKTLVQSAAMKTFEGISVDEAKYFSRQLTSALVECRSKKKSTTSGTKTHPAVKRVMEAMSAWDHMEPPSEQVAAPKRSFSQAALPLTTQPASSKAEASSSKAEASSSSKVNPYELYGVSPPSKRKAMKLQVFAVDSSSQEGNGSPVADMEVAPEHDKSDAAVLLQFFDQEKGVMKRQLANGETLEAKCVPGDNGFLLYRFGNEEQCESDTPNLALHIVSKPMPKTLLKKPGMKMKKPAASLALKEPEVAEPAAPAASVSDEVPLHCISKTRASEPERTYIQACQCHFPHAKAKEHKKQLIVQYSLAQDGPDHFDKAVKAMKYIEDHCLTWSQARNIKTLFPQ